MNLMTFILLLTLAPAEKSFQHTVCTPASGAEIWRIWTDVPNWHTWDSGLTSAQLEGSFGPGAKGTLVSDGGNKARFKITDITDGQAYTFETRLPLGKLVIRREWKQENGQTCFTHIVSFKGLSAGLFWRMLAPGYQQKLPEAMENIRAQAEKQ